MWSKNFAVSKQSVQYEHYWSDHETSTEHWPPNVSVQTWVCGLTTWDMEREIPRSAPKSDGRTKVNGWNTSALFCWFYLWPHKVLQCTPYIAHILHWTIYIAHHTLHNKNIIDVLAPHNIHNHIRLKYLLKLHLA